LGVASALLETETERQATTKWELSAAESIDCHHRRPAADVSLRFAN
jgi:hypothetical protein